MDLNIDIDALRRKHKTELVERALSVYQPEGDTQQVKSFWLERLLQGQDLRQMLDHLKAGEPLPEGLAPPAEKEQGGEEERYAGTAAMRQRLEVLRAGMPEKLRIAISNRSAATWENTEATAINACYHWLDEHGEVVQFDGVRTPLPEPIAPSVSLEFELNVIPPSQPGRYQLQLTLVHEGVCWFEEQGFTATAHPVDIEWCLPASTTRVLEEFAYGRDVWAQQEAAA